MESKARNDGKIFRISMIIFIIFLSLIIDAKVNAQINWSVSFNRGSRKDANGEWIPQGFSNKKEVQVSEVRIGQSPGYAQIADFNKDGLADVFATWSDKWWLSFNRGGRRDTNGEWIPRTFSGWNEVQKSKVRIGQPPNYGYIADFNNDGLPDVFATWGDKWHVSFNRRGRKDANGEWIPRTFSGWKEVQGSKVRIGQPPNYGQIADFNNDGMADVFATWGDKWHVSFNRGGRRDANGEWIPRTFRRWKEVQGSKVRIGQPPNYGQIADFNNDGLPDVFATWKEGGSGHWWVSFNRGGQKDANGEWIPKRWQRGLDSGAV